MSDFNQNPKQTKKSLLLIGVVLIIGAILSFMILKSPDSSTMNLETSQKDNQNDHADHAKTNDHFDHADEKSHDDEKNPNNPNNNNNNNKNNNPNNNENNHANTNQKDSHDHEHENPNEKTAQNIKKESKESNKDKDNQPKSSLKNDEKEKENSNEAEIKRVTFTDEQLKFNGVEIAQANFMAIQSRLPLLGEVKLNQDKSVLVTPRLAGSVQSVLVNAGDHVRKGQVLAVISSQTLADQRSELLASQKRLSLAQTTFEREKKLWEEKISAEQDYLNAKQTFQEAQIVLQSAQQKLKSLGIAQGESLLGLTRYDIRSPISGVVTQKKISVGESLKEDAFIFQIADLSSVWVELSVPAKDIHQVEIGNEAIVSASSVPFKAQAKLSYVGALVGEQSRQAIARLVLNNQKNEWKPGLLVNVELASSSDSKSPVLAIQANALQSFNDQNVVFVKNQQQFEARFVQLGRSNERFVEVRQGLQAGEFYVSKNSFLIKAEMSKSVASHEH